MSIRGFAKGFVGFYICSTAGSIAWPFTKWSEPFEPESKLLEGQELARAVEKRQPQIDAVSILYQTKWPSFKDISKIDISADIDYPSPCVLDYVFTKDVSFNDPVVCLKGRLLVCAAFRGLECAFESESEVVQTTHFEQGSLVQLDQKWTFLSLFTFRMREDLWFEFCETYNIYDSNYNFKISKIVDLWMGKSLIPYSQFVRSLTGSITCVPLFLAQKVNLLKSNADP
uniref:Uncharacterized protein n=1 Tax=Timspurckia oligopyrenoides TaxID=708627 RepID=A0A7S0ZLK4_9RHOD|mmetsp:Transcript_9977/g.17965  ORF Transcript_9977/g.17965 Transcript_9977/m.17965 type:complete len:228 (+) Transcript_9977:65-748(+)